MTQEKKTPAPKKKPAPRSRQRKMSTGMKVAVAIGGIVVTGAAVYGVARAVKNNRAKKARAIAAHKPRLQIVPPSKQPVINKAEKPIVVTTPKAESDGDAASKDNATDPKAS